MASVVEVETSKPSIVSATLKLSRPDLMDLKVFIDEWYLRNARASRAADNRIYKAVNDALAGKADPAPAPNPFF